jgi:hypothetical protein
VQDIIENGHQSALEELPDFKPYEALPVLPQGALRRLWRLQVALNGATEVAQAALNVHQAHQSSYRQAFEAACEDAGIPIPEGEQDVQIDWNTGDVAFTPRQR